MRKGSYRDSHTHAEKGAEYDAYYQTQPWERFLWSRERDALSTILDKYFPDRDVHLLDFACGTGRISRFLEDRVETSTAVDVSDSMLAIARGKLTRTEIIKADLTRANVLKPRLFNLITVFRFFLNAEPELRIAAISSLVDLLSDNGYLVFNNHRSLGSPWIKLMHLRQRQRTPDDPLSVMSIQEMQILAQAAGLEIVEFYPIGFFRPPKISVSNHVNRAIDSVACRFRFLNGFSENPIAVCRRATNQNASSSTSASGE